MIYLEYNSQEPGGETRPNAIELNCETIAEAARLFLAFEAGTIHSSNVYVYITNIGTSRRRGVTYERWSGL